ncbi:hypothetical protein Y032_0058g2934 [Ancylostoma ceylanicum]|uniref:Uncharacterized protein n=1 Tax=Ancylostoma ceylanicum TaxID=53326 RepID=A0A016U4D3_9BILA|nr:hypothetical protein Y032_0058g2934 [Ancylostoma ceylanicum]
MRSILLLFLTVRHIPGEDSVNLRTQSLQEGSELHSHTSPHKEQFSIFYENLLLEQFYVIAAVNISTSLLTDGVARVRFSVKQHAIPVNLFFVNYRV